MLLQSFSEKNKLITASFAFSHKSDWTKFTKHKDFTFKSLRHFKIAQGNVEILLVKYSQNSQKIEKFMNMLVAKKKIHSILEMVNLSSHLMIIAILGPIRNTVRHVLTSNSVADSVSTIHDGLQHWTIVAKRNELEKIIRSLGKFGVVKETSGSDTANLGNVLSLSTPWSTDLTTLELLLTSKELEVMKTAIKFGFFEKDRKITVAQIASELKKNKSTVNREIRSGTSKVIKFITCNLQLSSLLNRLG